MKKSILAAVPLALLALALPAAAQAKRAVTYKAKLAPTAGSSLRGKASLVDGKRRDKLQLRVKGLQAGATYTWALRNAPAGGDACSGDAVASFTYSSLEGRRGGNANARSRTKGFKGGSGFYAVVVTDAEGDDVACLELKSKAQRRAAAKQRSEAGDDGSAEDENHFDEEDELGDEEDVLGDDDGSEDLGEDEPVDDDHGDDAGDETLF